MDSKNSTRFRHNRLLKLKCPQCPKVLRNSRQLETHLKIRHTKKIGIQKTFTKRQIDSKPRFVSNKKISIEELLKDFDDDEDEVEKYQDITPIPNVEDPLMSNDVKQLVPECECVQLTDKAFTYNGFLKYVCSSCQSTFEKPREMHKHMDSVHREGLISMFFPNHQEFRRWKANVEKSTKSLFLYKTTKEHKEFYFCAAHIHSDDPWVFTQCPAMMISRTFDRGIQVFFLLPHHGHSSIEYEPDESVAKYVIDKTKKSTAAEKQCVKKTKDDLYKDFSDTMYRIVKKCLNLRYDDLEHLLCLANTMEFSVNDKMKKDPNFNHVETSDNNDLVIKKEPTVDSNTDLQSTIDATSSLANNNEIVYEVTIKKEPNTSSAPFIFRTPVNFNDTYKSFIENEICKKTTYKEPKITTYTEPKKTNLFYNSKTEEKTSSLSRKPGPKSRTQLRTKIGNVSSKTKPNIGRDSPELISKKIQDYELKERENDCNILILKF